MRANACIVLWCRASCTAKGCEGEAMERKVLPLKSSGWISAGEKQAPEKRRVAHTLVSTSVSCAFLHSSVLWNVWCTSQWLKMCVLLNRSFGIKWGGRKQADPKLWRILPAFRVFMLDNTLVPYNVQAAFERPSSGLHLLFAGPH
eukprot:scaffold287952_cov36-Tisochrysis_lutea.AAC.1